MDQIKQLLAALSLRQKISIAIALLVIGAGCAWLVSWRKESDFRPLYTNVAPEDAAGVVQKIKESGSEYRLENNGTTILAPSGRLAELRIALAKDGLPKSGRIGFELFDKTNFGTTDFAEHVNYRRALEGELERSIMSLAEIEHARVHLTFPKESVYTESRQPAKASVLLTVRDRAQLTAASVSGIAHLVASAVEGLAPEAVAVVDKRGKLLNKPHNEVGEEGGSSLALAEYRQTLERELLTKINNTLEPVLGENKFRSGVSVDCDLTTVEESEEILDPAKSVMVTTQKTEDMTNSATPAGIPGTASNLPRPAARPQAGSSGTSRRTENVTYQTSRKVRHVKVPKGTIRRVSVAVLLDQSINWQKVGNEMRRNLVPPAPETLKIVKDLVTNVAGLDAARGDQITVDSLPFGTTLNEEPPVVAPTPTAVPKPQPQWLTLVQNPEIARALQGGAVLIVVASMIWIVLRKRRRRLVTQVAAELPPASSDGHSERIEAGGAGLRALEHATRALTAGPGTSEILVTRLKTEIEKDSATAVKVLRTWIQETR